MTESTFTFGTLNLLKTNSRAEVAHDLGKAIALCDILVMQENTRDPVRAAVGALAGYPNWTVDVQTGAVGANPIAWRSDLFDMLTHGHRLAHHREANVTPARHVTWVALRHKESGLSLLVIDVHPINAYAGQNKPPRALRDQFAEAYWRTVVDVTEELQGAYDGVLLGGDFNVRLANRDEDWYPGHLLAPLYRFDHGSGIDHVLIGHATPLVVVRHGHVRDLNSDHDLHYAVLSTSAVPTPPPPVEEPVMRFVSRAEWGSSGVGATPSSHPIGTVYGITAHWEGPGIGGFPHSRCARKVRAIERFHKVNRGWADIAYNAVVCPHGYVFEGRGPNVRSASNGTSSIGGNDHWYGVCYLGGTGDPFTEAGKAGFLDAFDWLTRKGGAGPQRNGHRDHHATACPGDAIYRWVHSAAVHQTPTTDWFDMATKQDLQDAIREITFTITVGDHTEEWTLQKILRNVEATQDRMMNQVKALDPNQIADAVVAKLPTGGVTEEAVKAAVRAVLIEGVGANG
jgi:hypothetical protein